MLKIGNHNKLYKNALKIHLFPLHKSYIKYSKYKYSVLLN